MDCRRSAYRISTLVAVGASALVATAGNAALIAGWTMDHSITSSVGNSFTYGAADQGLLAAGTSLSGNHAQANATWTTPAGNGSQYAFSSDRWSNGDYYEIQFSTVGYESITLSWDQTRSATGPSDFQLFVAVGAGSSISATTFTYNVFQAGAIGSGTNAWSSTGTRQLQFVNTVQLGALLGSSVENNASITVRFQAVGINLGNGTNRIDNIMVDGVAMSVPAPGAAALLALAGAVGGRRRLR